MTDDNVSIIKKKNDPQEFISKEEFERRIKEIARCKRDPIYFANKYFRIISMNEGLQVIKMYPKQEELLSFFCNNNRCICLSARQSAKTTTYTIYCLWATIFFPDKKIMILANKNSTALEILDRIKRGYEYLPAFLKPRCVVWNKGQILFGNRSEIRGFASSSDAARGFSATCIVLDEFAFLPKNVADKLFTSIYPTISTAKDGKVIIVSTPNGCDNNLYYDIWTKANAKDRSKSEGWSAFRMNWWDVPGRDEKFKEHTIASIGIDRWNQEFACEFMSSTSFNKLIPDDITEKYKMKLAEYRTRGILNGKEIAVTSDANKAVYKFTMWHGFDDSHTYVGSADVSEGVGGDASVMYIWDVTDLRNITQCAKFSSNQVSINEFAFICRKILEMYYDPPFICEANGCGAGFIDTLRNLYGYDNLVREAKDNRYGVRSHNTVKSKACLWARDMFTTDGFGWTIYDKDLLDEIGTFIKKDTKGLWVVYQAMKNCHDDHIMSLIWTCYVLQPDIVEKYFVCCENFTSALGHEYPRLLQPYDEYDESKINAIYNDDVYRQYQEFKNEVYNKFKEAKERESNESIDPFFNLPKKKENHHDNFIILDGATEGFFDFDGPTW